MLLYLLFPISLFAQSLSIEQNVAKTIWEYQQQGHASYKKGEYKASHGLMKRAKETLIGIKVNPFNIEDQHGEVWNLGVFDQPFVIHAISNWDSGLNDRKIRAANVLAEEKATELITFLLMPAPVNALDSQRLATVSEKIVVVFMEMTSYKDRAVDDTRLLSILNVYPITYYIRADREIVGMKLGVNSASPKVRETAEATEQRSLEKEVTQLRKDVQALLRGKKIKRN